jgi:hypothetical protein
MELGKPTIVKTPIQFFSQWSGVFFIMVCLELRAKNLTMGSYIVPAVKQLILPKYKTKSSLTRGITSVTTKLDFDLKSN